MGVAENVVVGLIATALAACITVVANTYFDQNWSFFIVWGISVLVSYAVAYFGLSGLDDFGGF